MTFFAHLGHGLDGIWSGVLHPLTGIDHLLAMVAVGILATVAADRRLAWATPAAFVAAMVAGGVAGLAGVWSGFVEPTIAVSVMALGAIIAATTMPSLRAGAWVVAVASGAGAVHGIAHGAEVPQSASPAAYVVGFVAATVALHLAGAAIGSRLGRRPVLRTTVAGAFSTAGLAMLVGVPL